MKKENQAKNSSHKKGFTIIETLVAIFILLISTTGPLSFAQSSLRTSFLARDQIVAFYLTQEAIETLKNTRDNASLDGEDWLNRFEACAPSSDSSKYVTCELEVEQTDITFDSCDSSFGCAPLYYNFTDKRFTIDRISTNDVSKYTRTIYITKPNSREIQILVEVKWDSNFFGDKRIVAQENIFDWVTSSN